ncbi:hypothetical protein DL764_000533 [Monosporascus ibericus]|uniref:Major facilitator superfamily (MFS) profile domain-containing protein n=1 Tax=Monosporascus ibericus TaxID=155417 RepID=A0A4V1XCR3_9PEZI|nr:hypothetical protein DL764_000533 [Monosporascus ibericus]
MASHPQNDGRPGAAGTDETSPLLGPGTPSRRPAHRPTVSVTSLESLTSVRVPKVYEGRTIVGLLCIIVFVTTCSNGFIDTPLTRIIEDILCRRYYSSRGPHPLGGDQIDEKLCKENIIQTDLQDIISTMNMLSSIAAFVAAFPWGLAADRFGRKPVVVLAALGLLVGLLFQMVVLRFQDVFPVRLIWLSSACAAIGGGVAVVHAITMSIIADATSERDRAVAFMWVHVASVGGTLSSPTLGSLMMGRTGPWPCLWVGISLVTTGAISFLFLPETLHQKQQGEEAEEVETVGIKSPIAHTLDEFKEALSIIRSRSLVLLILVVFVAMPVNNSVSQFMAQFTSKRYGIKLSQTGYVQTLYGVSHVFQAFIILPWLSRAILRSTTPAKLRASDEHHRDLLLARWSFEMLVVGTLLLGLANTLPGFVFGLIVMALGSAYSSLVQSLMTLYVDPEHTSRLFSLVGSVPPAANVQANHKVIVVEVLGAAYTQPFLAQLFKLGLRLGGGWIGLPYYGLSLLIALSVGLLLFVRLPKHAEHIIPEPEAVDQES